MEIDLWVFLAFLSAAMIAEAMIVNKIMISRYFNDSVSYLAYTLLTNAAFLIPLPFFIDVSLPAEWLIMAVMMGIGFGLAFYFQLKVFETEEASVVSILSRTAPLFNITLAVIFLGELLRLHQYAGAILLIASGLLVSLNQTSMQQIARSKAVSNILIFNVITALLMLARKYLLFHGTYWAIFYWSSFGTFLGGLLLLTLPRPRLRFFQTVHRVTPKAHILRLGTTIIYMVGTIVWNKALQIGPMSGVTSIYSTQPLFVVLYAYLFTRWAPRILTEDFSTVSAFQKMGAVGMAIVGGIIIAI